MISSKKAVFVFILQYFCMLLLHIIYGFFCCTQKQLMITLMVSGISYIVMVILLCFFEKYEKTTVYLMLLGIVSVVCYLGWLLNTLSFSYMIYITTALLLSVLIQPKYIVFWGAISSLSEIAVIIFYRPLVIEVYVCYLICYAMGMISIYYLVSCTKKSMNQLQEKVLEAEQANDYKGHFLANVSHELRNPLNVIFGMTQMLKTQQVEGNVKEYIESIESASKMLLTLTNDILALSKMESGKYEITQSNYKLIDIIHDINSMVLPKIDATKIKFIMDIDESTDQVLYGDGDRIRQIMMNLINNAVKYTKRGEICLKANCKDLEKENVLICLTVSDTGIGIKEEDRQKLFTSFERLDKEQNRNIEGNGLGLSICKNLISLMNGTITVESTYGKGSTFYVEIPQKIAKSQDENRAYLNDTRWKAPKARVLVVDDTKTNLTVATGLLKTFDIKADAAENGMDALEKMNETKFDLIFLDYLMPDMNGKELLNIIKSREDENFKNVPVVALTANSLLADSNNFKKLGFQDYLLKPIEISKLEQILKKYIIT